VLEAVPNVSEGRATPAIEAIGDAFGTAARVLDVHADADHHRSVFTLAGSGDALVEALLAGAGRAVELIDLRAHDGIHPRVGAVDVVPLVPLGDDDLEPAKGVALTVARRLGDDLGLTVFLYAEVGEGRPPAFFRRGGLAELERRVAAGELVPDHGPTAIDPRSGVVLVGARRPLVAYNVELATTEVEIARSVAAAVRESGGGMPGVQAIGLHLPRSRRVQVSMNVLELERSPLHEVVLRVGSEAAARGVSVAGGELVGLVPRSVVEAAAAAGVEVPGVDPSRTLEHALAGWF
jgi:glutamate formiminotransferase/glutamate formiminotransferase/formiminotetrahydrofolate cyclodeaminase